MSKETLKKSIREIPDFPIPGILFYDVTTLFKDPAALQELSDTMYEMYKDKGITKVVGIESRGFIMGPILATRLGAGFVPIRKPGKLPAETIEESYEKEYGKDTVQMHKDAIDENYPAARRPVGYRRYHGRSLQAGKADEPQENLRKLYHRVARTAR